MKYIKARVPDDVHAKLIALAAADHRSLNSMLIVLIEEADPSGVIPLPPEGGRRSTAGERPMTRGAGQPSHGVPPTATHTVQQD